MESRRPWRPPSLRTAQPTEAGPVLLACTGSPFGSIDCTPAGFPGCCATRLNQCNNGQCGGQTGP